MPTLEECEENVRYCRRNGNVEGEAIWLGAAAARYRDSSNGPKALEYFGEALRLWQGVGKQSNVANTYNAIALVYEDVLNDLPAAIDYCKLAISLATGAAKADYERDLRMMLSRH